MLVKWTRMEFNNAQISVKQVNTGTGFTQLSLNVKGGKVVSGSMWSGWVKGVFRLALDVFKKCRKAGKVFFAPSVVH